MQKNRAIAIVLALFLIFLPPYGASGPLRAEEAPPDAVSQAVSETDSEPSAEPAAEPSSPPEAKTESTATPTPEPTATPTPEPTATPTPEPTATPTPEPTATPTPEPTATPTPEPTATPTPEPTATPTPEPTATPTPEPTATPTPEPTATPTPEPTATPTPEPTATPTPEPTATPTPEPTATPCADDLSPIAPVSEIGSEEGETGSVVSITIDTSELAFRYCTVVQEIWDDETHSYAEQLSGKWTAAEESAVQLTNNSETAVTAKVSGKTVSAYGNISIFVDGQAESAKVISGHESARFEISLSGTATSLSSGQNTYIGTINISLAAVETAAAESGEEHAQKN